MKLKYIIPAFLAAFALFTGCSEGDDATLNGINVSSSYVALNMNGGSGSISVNTKDSWTIDASSIPTWLTVSPTSGSAGASTISFSAESTLDGRSAEIVLASGIESQRINVIQGISQVSDVTCAEVIAGPDSKTYRVTGVVKSISNTVYGNWYLEDETGDIYIYGTRDKSGSNGQNNSIAAWGIDVGDQITVQGPKTTYNGTVELVDVTVVDLQKSLIKVDSLTVDGIKADNYTMSVDGGEITAHLTCKGSGVNVDIPAEAKDWLSISSVTGGTNSSVTFHVAPNTKGSRETKLVFTTTDSGKEYTAETSIKQAGLTKGKGTESDPYNVAAAVEFAQKLGKDADGKWKVSDDNVYVKGIISSIKYTYSAKFGTATYNISDDGTESGVFTVYGSYYLNNVKWGEGDKQIAVGDEVIVCGKVINYNGTTPEFNNTQNWLVSLNGFTGENNGEGTLESPFNVKGACAAAAALENKVASTDEYYIKGKVSSVKYQFDVEHGTATFNISDDGSTDATQFTCYSLLYFGMQSWAEGNKTVAVGDEVIVKGNIVNFNGTLETSSKKACLYSLNGATE